nr:TaqI-like C-terminal specificity domain-containing protein [Halorientalis salina]
MDDVYDESNVFAHELGEDLQNNIYEAIKILSEGFMQYPDNNFSEDDLDLIHDSSLIYLYRLIFVLYAESEGRDLLDTNNEIYEESYSLNSLKQDIADELDSPNPKYQNWQTKLWDQLEDLFNLIDRGSESRGIPEEDLHIPAYNGGLFRTETDEGDSVEAKFLANHQVGDSYMAEVIDLLTRSQEGSGGGKIFVDYSSLDVRHLGSIYEGLLEYKLNIAEEPLTLDDGEYVTSDNGNEIVVQEGEVYLTTDSGERKVTGSYYTPEYVVEYIVENTLEPLVEDCRKAALEKKGSYNGLAQAFADEVFDLKILDPAMGSGHFLTNAVDYLAREIIDAQQKQAAQQGNKTVNDEHDINWARRQVAQRCIYGVDRNPLAVELSKVSLWLRTLAAEQPLAFLDHHLKTGNSLMGSDIEAVLDNGESDIEGGQLTLQQSFDRTRRQALEHVTDQFEELLSIDNETLDDIKEMETVYDEVQDDPLYQNLIAMANVHTAEQIGLDIPKDAYERMATALRDDNWEDIEEQDWYHSAQRMANDEHFFHWELEFPIAFYQEDGEKKDNPGFDVVAGNPPWLNAWRMTDEMPKQREAIKQLFESSKLLEGHWDLYIPFIIRSLNLCRKGGRHSFILPNLVLAEKYAKDLRRSILTDHTLESILDFGARNVFEDVERQSVIYIVKAHDDKTPSHEIQSCVNTDPFDYNTLTDVDPEVWLNAYNCQIRLDENYVEKYAPLIDKIEDNSNLLGQYLYVNVGATVASSRSGGFVKDDVVSEEPVGNAKKFIQGTNISRWYLDWDGEWLDYRPDEMSGPRQQEMFESEKLLVRKRTDEGGWIAAVNDDEGMYCDDTVLVCCDYDALEGTGATIDFEGFERLDENLNLTYAVALINSTLMTWLFKNKFETGGLQGTYSDVWPQSVRSFPIPETQGRDYPLNRWESKALEILSPQLRSKVEKAEKPEELLSVISESVIEAIEEQKQLNLNILDYLGIASDELPDSMADDKLENLQMPVSGVADTPLTETTEDLDGLRVEGHPF